jgi:hypothetical protein
MMLCVNWALRNKEQIKFLTKKKTEKKESISCGGVAGLSRFLE